MKSPKFTAMATMAISILGLSATLLRAATSGPFDYTVHGSSVTIDYYWANLGGGGALAIPATIEGKPVVAIGEGAFNGASKITSISIPATVTSIGPSAFSSCSGLREVNIPQAITIIEARTFGFCTNLVNLTIPSGVTRIDEGAFSSCWRLEKAAIPAGVTEIGDGAFAGCAALKAIVIPASVHTLGDGAFSSTGIGTIEIPATVKTIGNYLLAGCYNLRRVDFPMDFTTIGQRMFSGCSRLTRMTIPPTVTRIEKEAFRGCRGLSMVIIPKQVAEIGNWAFEDCENLESVIFTGKVPLLGFEVFESTASDFKIFIAEGAAGYTLPKWRGYRTSLPTAEIAVQNRDGTSLDNGPYLSKFASLIVGKPGSVNRFTIRNVGPRKLTGLYARITDGNSSDFIVKSLANSSLAPGKTTILEIMFLPRKSGKRVTELRIMSSDKDENPFVIDLVGTGLLLTK
jgi:BspA type Leucine rich repeat region (6 copies)